MKTTIPNTPQVRESLMAGIISFYRELHNRAKGTPCECGACRIAVQQCGNLGIDINIVDSPNREVFFRSLEVAGDADFDKLTEQEIVERLRDRQ
ncbi:MAG TPA: hypothetical protein VKR57_02450 [Terriglobales bacterium]|jgi:hypothetical protein|nr:hypothetical protein [Terriglobales bacterium]